MEPLFKINDKVLLATGKVVRIFAPEFYRNEWNGSYVVISEGKSFHVKEEEIMKKVNWILLLKTIGVVLFFALLIAISVSCKKETVTPAKVEPAKPVQPIPPKSANLGVTIGKNGTLYLVVNSVSLTPLEGNASANYPVKVGDVITYSANVCCGSWEFGGAGGGNYVSEYSHLKVTIDNTIITNGTISSGYPPSKTFTVN